MSKAPDSNATKHSLSSVQRQYIDSRIAEKLKEELDPLKTELKSINTKLSNVKTALTTLAIRIANLEEFVRDDNNPQNPLNSPRNTSIGATSRDHN